MPQFEHNRLAEPGDLRSKYDDLSNNRNGHGLERHTQRHADGNEHRHGNDDGHRNHRKYRHRHDHESTAHHDSAHESAHESAAASLSTAVEQGETTKTRVARASRVFAPVRYIALRRFAKLLSDL